MNLNSAKDRCFFYWYNLFNRELQRIIPMDFRPKSPYKGLFTHCQRMAHGFKDSNNAIGRVI